MTARQQTNYAVAIIGVAGRFPGSNTVEGLWKNLCDGKDCLHISTDEELKKTSILEWQKKHPDFVRVNGVIEGAAEFDAQFFGFSAHDASIVDPQHRVFLECAWEAFEDAGYDPTQSGEGVGVFTGAGTNTYRRQDLGPTTDTATTLQLMVGGEKDFLATRVAYKLNLTGPAITVQTACSTSLVAVQMAYESLRSGTCTMAVAGGVSIMFPQETGYIYQPGMILSPDGYCRAFDARAQGTTIGRGAGAVLLKPLDKAVRDGDQIYAVIRGAAINNDGANKGGYTAPGVKGQAEVIRRAMQMAQFDPSTVHYVEAHGTGTEIGDSIEIAALAEAFSGNELRPGSCTVSSLKASIGHLDAAAGVANLIKAAMAVRARVLPGTMHFETPNPELKLETTPFRISRHSQPYTGADPMRAGVSAFGIGGTNVHVCIEEWQDERQPNALLASSNGNRVPSPAAGEIFPLSAQSEKALASQRERLAAHLESHPEQSLEDVAYTLQTGRKLFSHRYFAVAANRSELIAQLRNPELPKSQYSVTAAKDPEVYFLFPGQGAQYVNMGRDLYETDSVFHDAIDQCSTILEPLLKLDLRSILFPAPGEEEAATAILKQTSITQPALFSFEYALAMRLLASGVRPAALLGHSLGEYVAATVAGVFALKDILTIVAERGRIVQTISSGSMLAVSLPEEGVLAQLPPELSVAAVNAPRQTIVSGPTEAIDAFALVLAKQRIACAPLATSHAFHSAMLDPIVGSTAELVARFPRAVPSIPIISNLTGKWITDAQARDPWYYDAHLRQAVRFSDGLQLLTEKGSGVIVEVGPGETLLPLARSATKGIKGIRLVSTTRRAASQATDSEHWLHSMGQLWLAGVKLNWASVHHSSNRRRVSLPTYPFERQYYWIDDAWGLATSIDSSRDNSPLDKREDIARWIYTPRWSSTVPLPSFAPAINSTDSWLVFADPTDAALHHVRISLGATARVISVAPGSSFHLSEDGSYSIDADNAEHYTGLLQQLHETNTWPTRIVFAYEQADQDASPRSGYSRLFYMAEALRKSGREVDTEVIVLTRNAYDVFGEGKCNPSNRALAWLGDVMGVEVAGLKRRVIDRDLKMPAIEEAPRLLAELTTDTSAVLVALRGRKRWIEDWIPLPLSPSAEMPLVLRQRGTYILTGGVGGLGLVLAEYLACRVAARLVLVSRSAFPPQAEWAKFADDESSPMHRKAKSLLRILAAGGSVEIQQGDVQDVPRMVEIVAHARSNEGGLCGIIHAAGIVDGTVIGATDPIAIERIFAAKAEGTRWIEKTIGDGSLDFVLLCSSLSSVIPSIGLSTYGASNAYLDGFAAVHDNLDQTRVISVNWDNWSETGMAVEAATLTKKRSAGARTVELGISNEEGGRVFELVLNSPVSQVAVSTRDLPRLIVQVRSAANVQQGENGRSAVNETMHPRPELSQDYTAPQNEIELCITEIWQELLGLERVGTLDDFFELGGHSLLGAQVIARIRERFQVDLPMRIIFDSPTPAAIARLVSEGLSGPISGPVLTAREPARDEIEI